MGDCYRGLVGKVRVELKGRSDGTGCPEGRYDPGRDTIGPGAQGRGVREIPYDTIPTPTITKNGIICTPSVGLASFGRFPERRLPHSDPSPGLFYSTKWDVWSTHEVGLSRFTTGPVLSWSHPGRHRSHTNSLCPPPRFMY